MNYSTPPAILHLPQPILLLHLAQLHLHQSHLLIPLLTIRPTQQYHLIGTLHYKPKPIHPPNLAWAASTYRKHISIAIACLRSILTLAQVSPAESISIELNLIARCKLIQILLSETKEYQQAIDLIQHGLHLSRQRDNLTPFKLILTEFLIKVEASDPNISFRQIKKQIERAVELTIKNNVVDQKYTSSYYRFQLLLCHISYERAKDFPAALAALKNVINLAERRNDWELWVACKTHEIKLAMDRCEWKLVGELLKFMIPTIEFNLESQTSLLSMPENHQSLQQPPPEKIIIDQQLKTYIMLLLIIFYSIVGETALAKGWLKHLQTELDSPMRENGEAEGTCKIYLKSYPARTHQRPIAQLSPLKTNLNHNLSVPFRAMVDDSPDPLLKSTVDSSNSAVNSQYVLISIMPRELIYTVTYLVSLAVYLDGHGKTPKSLIYAREGLKQIDRQLTIGFQYIGHHNDLIMKNNQELTPLNHSYYHPSIIISINSWLKTLLAMKLETNILITQLAIVRSDFLYADQILVEVIRRVSDSENWEIYNARISFLKSMLSHATGNLAFARQSLLTTLHLVRGQTKSINHTEKISYAGELSTLSKACYFFVRMAENDFNPSSQQQTRMSFDGSSFSPLTDTPRSLALDHLIKELAVASQLCIPSIGMAIQIALAMSCGEIVKAKYHLTTALNEANKTSNTHLKMILLGLLSTMFLNTRSDQATEMLKSCFKLSLGFSSSAFSTSTITTQTHDQLDSNLAKNQDAQVDNLAGFKSIGVNDIVVGNPSLGLWVGKKLVEIYELQESSVIKDEEKKSFQVKIQRLKLSNQAHQNHLDLIPLL